MGPKQFQHTSNLIYILSHTVISKSKRYVTPNVLGGRQPLKNTIRKLTRPCKIRIQFSRNPAGLYWIGATIHLAIIFLCELQNLYQKLFYSPSERNFWSYSWASSVAIQGHFSKKYFNSSALQKSKVSKLPCSKITFLSMMSKTFFWSHFSHFYFSFL